MNVTFNGEELDVVFGSYGNNGNTAIQLVNKDDELYTVATVNLEKEDKDIVGIKDYSENEGMVDALVEAGVIEKHFVKMEPSGFIVIPYFPLTEKAKELRDKQFEEQ